ncbi:DUF86 domain-containing protein [Halorhodospira halochloris]|nr:DUF86 domain-containing protein [Halorhodospira halochloris]
MRNAIAHGYFKVDFEIVWNTIHREWTSTLSEHLNAWCSAQDQAAE